MSHASEATRKHLEEFFPDSGLEYFSWTLGPIGQVLPEFRVCRIAPRNREKTWVYVSVGACEVKLPGEYETEFFFLSPRETPIHIETLAMVAYFHATLAGGLDIGHFLRIGRPWLDESPQDRLLTSIPYPFGPKFEWCRRATRPIRFVWLLPVAASEVAFAREHGLEALEDRFDQHAIDATDPRRPPVA